MRLWHFVHEYIIIIIVIEITTIVLIPTVLSLIIESMYIKQISTSQLSLLWGSIPSIRREGGTFKFLDRQIDTLRTKKHSNYCYLHLSFNPITSFRIL